MRARVRWNREAGFHLCLNSTGTIIDVRFDTLYLRRWYTVRWDNGLRTSEDEQNLIPA